MQTEKITRSIRYTVLVDGEIASAFSQHVQALKRADVIAATWARWNTIEVRDGWNRRAPTKITRPAPLTLEFSPAIDRQDWTYSTVYLDGKPVATVTRRGVYDKTSPAYTAHWCDGSKLDHAHGPISMARRIRQAITKRGIANIPAHG